jgi:hypothetical protein
MQNALFIMHIASWIRHENASKIKSHTKENTKEKARIRGLFLNFKN